MFFMFYSMIGKFKITQWQHCWICLQQVGHVEIYIFLIKTYKQVRVSPDDSICSCCDLWIMNGVTCDIFLILLAFVAEIVIKKNGMHVWFEKFSNYKFYGQGLESILIGNNPFGWSYCLSVNWERYKV